MPSTYTATLGFEKQADGENSSTWGQKVNTAFDLIEDSISDVGAISMVADANKTLSSTDGAVDESRSAVLEVTSTLSLTATRSIIVPTADKVYLIKNGTSGSQSILVTTASGTGITIKNGEKRFVYCDGTNIVESITAMSSLVLDTPLAIAEGGTGATSAAAILTAIGAQAKHDILDDLSGLTQATDKLPYFSSSTAMTTASFTTFARTILDDADASAVRTTLGLGTLSTKSTVASADITDGTIANADIASSTITGAKIASDVALAGNPTTTTQTSSDNSTRLATTAYVTTAAGAISGAADAYPVGSLYMNASNSTNPATLLGFGTWSEFGEGRMLLGESGSYSAGSTGGSSTHTLTAAQLPDHNHVYKYVNGQGSGSGVNFAGSSTGLAYTYTATVDETITSSTNHALDTSGIAAGTYPGGGAHSIMSPYITVYMWQRTA
jgi:hypothetical protein